MPCCLAHS